MPARPFCLLSQNPDVLPPVGYEGGDQSSPAADAIGHPPREGRTMSKKITVLALSVSVAAALALPASASAAWKDHSTQIQKDVQFGLTGQVSFETGFGSANCQAAANVTFFAGQTTGAINTWGPHPGNETTNCKGVGPVAGCQSHNLAPLAPNWTIHTGGTEGAPVILITTQDITSQITGAFCPVNQLRLTAATLVATPNQPNTVTSFQLSGTLEADKVTPNGTVDKGETKIGGFLTISEAEKKHTYSI